MIRFGIASQLPESVYMFFDLFIRLNLILFIFNLLPLPPLDGYRILEDLAPVHLRPKLTQLEAYGSLIFIILVVTPLYQYTIGPLMNTVFPLLITQLDQFFYRIILF